MKRAFPIRPAHGFSLLEVLLAVTVLAFGLLALASLQASLIRASADAKAQSVAVSLAKDLIEDLRSYPSMNSVDPPGYNNLANDSDTVDDESGSLGGVSFTRTWTVERYVFDGSDFVLNGTPDPAYPNNEFKRVQVQVAWNDAAGNSQSITLEDAIGAVDPQDSARLGKISKGAKPRGPETIIYDPSETEGVIPIAVGDNTDTAATNPRPVVAGRNNDERVVETRFDVLTYAAITGDSGLAQAQSRVETAVVGCTCDTATATAVKSLRPTFWNGVRYTVPAVASYDAPAGHVTLGNNDPPESRLCDVCCRDHHDPSDVTGAKFDRRRSASGHLHYLAGNLSSSVTSGTYTESCRLVRVDGIFRVAADAFNDHFGLLETENGQTSVDPPVYGGPPWQEPFPKASAETNYQNFVLAYLNSRFVSGSDADGYNDPAEGNAASHEVTYNLNSPTRITIRETGDFKWLHSRGLYVDWLEAEAVDAIETARQECQDRVDLVGDPDPCSTDELKSEILKRLPFTSINLSEIGNWSPIAGDQIVVTNNDFSESIDSDDPVRGKVLPGGDPDQFAEPEARADVFASNSGLALLLDPIDPDEAADDGDSDTPAPPTPPLFDTQRFRIDGGGQADGGGVFQVTFSNYPFGSSSAAYPTITTSPASTCNFATTGGSKPNPYSCTGQQLGVAMSLALGNYNYQLSSNSTATLSCTGEDGPQSYTPTGQGYAVNICKNFAVQSASIGAVDGTVGLPSPSDGVLDEETTVSFVTVNANDIITVTMSAQSDDQTPVNCTYIKSEKPNGDVVYTFNTVAQECP